MLLINIWKETTFYSKIGNHRLATRMVYVRAAGLERNTNTAQPQRQNYLLAARWYHVWAHASESWGPLLLDQLAYACHMVTSNKLKLVLIFEFTASLWLMPFFRNLTSVILEAYIIPSTRAHFVFHWPSSEYPVILNYITKHPAGLLWTYPL